MSSPVPEQPGYLTPVWLGIAIAFLLWTFMFGVGYGNFWGWMVIATLSLASLSIWQEPRLFQSDWSFGRIILWGVGSAAILYGIFTVGDLLTRWLEFQDQQVRNIYGTKSELPHWLIGILLVFPIGPGEEIFWRGLVQKRMMSRWGDWTGLILAVLCYTMMHITSLNLMLIGAAATAGLFWGIMYKLTREMLPCVISHALWDMAIFIVFPMKS